MKGEIIMEKLMINIWPDDPSVKLSGRFNSGEKRPALLILPGGGYNICAPVEGDAVADKFYDMGYAAFVLEYSTRFGSFSNIGGEINIHTLFPEPLREVAAAVKYIRDHAPELGSDGDALALMGFSAGGHLAACYSNLWNSAEVFGGMAENAEKLRPNACVLIYPALRLHSGEMLMKAIYGERESYTQQECARYSAENLVSQTTPPTFIFHSVTDPMVPFGGSRHYSVALQEAGIAHEVHLFGRGGHAYGIAEGRPEGIWTSLAHSFLQGIYTQPDAYDKEKVLSTETLRRAGMKKH